MRKVHCDQNQFEVDKENLNLAKRILFCQSDHNHKFYQKEWKKAQNYLKVRSNFKKNIFSTQPRIFKFEPILGKGKCLISLCFQKFESNPVNFHIENQYMFNICLNKNHIKSPTIFTLPTLKSYPFQFYIPFSERKSNILLKICEVKQNQIHEKGKMQINLNIKQSQEVAITNVQGKEIGCALLNVRHERWGRKQGVTEGNERIERKGLIEFVGGRESM